MKQAKRRNFLRYRRHRRYARVLAVLAACSPLFACATFVTRVLDPQPGRIYPAVEKDLQWGARPFLRCSAEDCEGLSDTPLVEWPLLVVATVDFPISFAVDTSLLPFDLTRAINPEARAAGSDD